MPQCECGHELEYDPINHIEFCIYCGYGIPFDAKLDEWFKVAKKKMRNYIEREKLEAIPWQYIDKDSPNLTKEEKVRLSLGEFS